MEDDISRECVEKRGTNKSRKTTIKKQGSSEERKKER